MKFESEPLRRQVTQTVADFYNAESNEALVEGIYTSHRQILLRIDLEDLYDI